MFFISQSLSRSIGLVLIFSHVGVAAFTGSVLGNLTSARVFNHSRPTSTSIQENQNATAVPPYRISTITNVSATLGAIPGLPEFFQNTALSTHPLRPGSKGTLIRNSTSSRTLSSSSSLPTNSSMDPIMLCLSESKAWYEASKDYYATAPLTGDWSQTGIMSITSTSYQLTWTCSSTCGNVCYAEATTLGSTVLSSSSSYRRIRNLVAPFPKETPSCVIPTETCASIRSAYYNSHRIYHSWLYSSMTLDQAPKSPSWLGCEAPPVLCYCQAYGLARLFYWPPSKTTSRDMCTGSNNRSTEGDFGRYSYPQEYEEIKTAAPVVLSGRTFYPGNIYLSIPTIIAETDIGRGSTGSFTDVMLTMASSDLQSVRMLNGRKAYVSVDYGDFMEPIPWSAYNAMIVEPTCGQRSKNCSTSSHITSVVLRSHYHPVFRVPDHIRTLHPDLYLCAIIAVVTDPPIALPEATLVLPTSHHATTTPTAEPGLPVELVPIRTNTATGTQVHQTPRPGVPKPSTNLGRPGGKQEGPSFDPMKPAEPSTVVTRPLGYPFGPESNNREGNIVYGGTTIPRGGAAATIGDATIRVGDSGITVSDKSGTRIIEIPKAGGIGNGDSSIPNHIIDIGGHSYTMDAARNLVQVTDPTTFQGGPSEETGFPVVVNALSVGSDRRATPGQQTAISSDSLRTAVTAMSEEFSDSDLESLKVSTKQSSQISTPSRRDGRQKDGAADPTNTKSRGVASVRAGQVSRWWLLLLPGFAVWSQ